MLADKPWEEAKNILAIRLDSLGDVLMTTPAIRALRESLPGRRVTLLTSEAGAAISPFIPEIDETIIYAAPWMKATPALADSRNEYRMAAKLQQAGFDGAVIFTVFSQNPLPAAFLCHLAGIPLRLAYCRENPYQLLTNWVKETEPETTIRHEVRRQLDLVASIGAVASDERLSLAAPPEARSRALQLLSSQGVDLSQPWIAIHPGASAASRRYPAEQYAEVARILAGDCSYQVVFTGGQSERDLVDTIRQSIQTETFSLAGKLSLAELIALVDQAPLLITNNTGPAHIAAALGTPVVDLYALTNPQHTPWMGRSRVLSYDVPCKNCFKSVCPEGHHNCLRLIRPEQVVEAALDLLQEVGEAVR